MKDKKIFKKWWFWTTATILVAGIIGSLGETEGNTNSANEINNSQRIVGGKKEAVTLPKLDTATYIGQEGLIVYKELKSKGYGVKAEFKNQALTDINGKASDVFDPLNPNRSDDRQSVDAFTVGSFRQDGNNVTLGIAHSSK